MRKWRIKEDVYESHSLFTPQSSIFGWMWTNHYGIGDSVAQFSSIREAQAFIQKMKSCELLGTITHDA